MSCCRKIDQLASAQELNEGETFYFDFVINELPTDGNTNLIAIERESQLMLTMVKKNEELIFLMKNDNQQIFIHQVQQGVFQQIFIMCDKEYLIIEWHSDFQIIYKENLGSSQQKTRIINKQDFICQQQIKNEILAQFITSCKDASNIQIQLHPQVQYLHSETFNNNFYKISFWIKQLGQDNQNMNIQIIDENNGKLVMIIIEWLKCTFKYDYIIIIQDVWKISGWNYFQFTYQRKHGVFKYQRDDNVQEIMMPQNYQYEVRLYVRPHKNIIFMDALLQISQQSSWHLCVPGCLKCDSDGHCLECDFGYQQKGKFCECLEDYQFLFSPSECYIQLDYTMLESKTSRNCPTFGGQKCPQCEDGSVDNFQYCLFATDIDLYSEYLELDYNYFHLLVQYQQIDEQYQIDNHSVSKQMDFANIIYYQQDKKDFYLIGYTNSKNIICYKNYYYNYVCKKQVQFCKTQFQNQVCKQCHENHFLINGKCKRCPEKCEFCQIIRNQMLCIKCVMNYFLNFQRKCVFCGLELCEMCYQYQGQQNTLERNFVIQQKSFKYLIGCSYCKFNGALQIEKRKCVQKEDNNVIINSKRFEHNQVINQLKCREEIFQCQFCQNGYCLQCNDNYILNVNSNICHRNQNNLKLSNFNLNMQDHEIKFNLVTFLYFNYSYIDIIEQQQQYYLMDCQFSNFSNMAKILDIDCDRQLLYLTFKKQECPVYCLFCLDNKTCLNYKYIIDFNINLTVQYIKSNFELEMMNSYINNVKKVKQLELHTNTLNIKINTVTPQFFQSPANIPYHPAGQNINLHFTNALILDNSFLYFEESVSIIDSVFNVFKDLTIEFNNVRNGIFILKNVIFQGQNNQSSLNFEIKCSNLKFQNVTFVYFNFLYVSIQSKDVIINGLNLIKLAITNDDKIMFLIVSKLFYFTDLNIYKCNFTNIIIFELFVYGNKIQLIEKLFINSVILNTSRLITFPGYYQQKGIVMLKYIFIQYTISQNSILFCLEKHDNFNQHSIFISELLFIQLSKFTDSEIFHSYGEINEICTATLSQIIVKKNIFKNSSFISFQMQEINLTQIHVQDNDYISDNYFFKFVAYTIHLTYFDFQNNVNQLGRIISLSSEVSLLLNKIVFKNCSFIQNQDQISFNVVLLLRSERKIKLTNVNLININSSYSLITLIACFGQLDKFQILNIQFKSINIHVLEIMPIIERQNEIRLKYLIFDNIFQEFQHTEYLLNSIISINFWKVILDKLLVSNIRTSQNFITINSQVFQFYVRNFKAHNVSVSTLILSVSFFNLFNNFYLKDIITSQSLLQIESEYIDLDLDISCINLLQSQIFSFIIQIIYYNKDYFNKDQTYDISLTNIKIDQVKALIFLQIQATLTYIQISDIELTRSYLNQIFIGKGAENQFLIQQFKVDLVQCEYGNVSFIIMSKIIVINDLRFMRTINLAFSINSEQYYLNNIMFLECQVFMIQLQYLPLTNHIHLCSVNNMLILNNNFKETDLGGWVIFHLEKYSIQIQGLQFHNNTKTLLTIQGKFKFYIYFTNNICGQYCILVQKNSEILFKEIKNFQNEKIFFLKVDSSSSVLNFENELDNKNHIAIQINQNKIIKEFGYNQLLYLPSGQKLINYQTFDFININFTQEIYQISIVKHNDSNSGLIFGSFTIKVYEFENSSYKIIRDLSQFQNFEIFEQSESHLGLNDFQIIYDPYQENILMIEIQQISKIEEKLTVFAKTQLCQIGEIFSKNQCLICKPELLIYSLKQKSNFCSVVDEQIISDHLSGAVKLRKGYWRPFIYSSLIEKCDTKIDKCNGGWYTGNISCKIGYIGGICNACDIYNTRGNGYYSLEQNECKLCGEFKYIYLLFKFVLIISILCIRLTISLKSNIQNYKKLILYRLVNYRHFFILVKYITDIPSIIFRILIVNLAILKFIIQDSIELPDILTIFTNPIIIEQNSFTCIQQFIHLDYSYWLYYFKLIVPILTYNIFVVLLVLLLSSQNKIKTYFLFPMIQLFLSQGPTLLVLFVCQAIYNTYSNVKYTYFDFSLRYYSPIHQYNLKYMILPIIICLSFILPFMIMILIKRQVRNIYKDKFIQLGNFILPYNSNYQELLNYYKNSLILLLLQLNDKQLTYYNKTIIITLIMIINLRHKVYRIKVLSKIAYQQGANLIFILYFTYFVKQINLDTINILIMLTPLFILQQINNCIQILYQQNKLLIYEQLKNYNQIIKFLGLKNYNSSITFWKLIKSNHKAIVQQKIKILHQEHSLNEIILQTVKTQMTNNSLRTDLIEIEMVQL